MSSTNDPEPKINTSRFYHEWKGHQIQDLESFHQITLSQRPDKPIIYLAGDSSLDNKYWVHNTIQDFNIPVPEIYFSTLTRPSPKPDIAVWLNHLLGPRATCINAAVEASMLRERDTTLLPHDTFIRTHIRPQDTLIVSIGANDIALSPNARTIMHMLTLAWLTPRKALEHGAGCSMPYFKQLFGEKVQDYIARLTALTKPRAVIVCMIYFPLEARFGQRSWADVPLKALGYNSFPGQLQTGIRAIYESATKRVRVSGTMVVPCALFEVLDGKTPEAYTDRVEPSGEGGRRVAGRLVEVLEGVGGLV